MRAYLLPTSASETLFSSIIMKDPTPKTKNVKFKSTTIGWLDWLLPGRIRSFNISVPVAVALIKQTLASPNAA